jgi:hypothetical protein
MKCFLGNELEPGDRVVMLEAGSSSSWYTWGQIVRFTPKQVVLVNVYNGQPGKHEIRRYPKALIKP